MSDPAKRLDVLEAKMSVFENFQERENSRLDRQETRLDRLDIRFDRIDSELVSLHTKISEAQRLLEERISGLQERFDGRFTGLQERLDGRITDLHGAITLQTRWILGVFIGFLTAFIGGLAALFYKLFPILDLVLKKIA